MTPGPVPPPPPPAPPPLLLKEGSEKECGETETRYVSKEECFVEICGLVEGRSGDVLRGNDGEIVVVVVVPLEKVILQNGPMCGIVALAEAVDILKKCDNVTPKVILDEAIRIGLTKQGEMFSVEGMDFLGRKFGGCEKSEVLDWAKEPMEMEKRFIEHILTGQPALVPYDADFNHTPSLRKGHAAHWAVVHGLVFSCGSNALTNFTQEEKSPFKMIQSSPSVKILEPLLPNKTDTTVFPIEIMNLVSKHNSAHVIAHQGKSFRTALWKLQDLIDSNQNLKEMTPKILDHKDDFIFGNIEEGLCSKILLLK